MKNSLTKTLFISLLLSAVMPFGVQAIDQKIVATAVRRGSILILVLAIGKVGTDVRREAGTVADESDEATQRAVSDESACQQKRESAYQEAKAKYLKSGELEQKAEYKFRRVDEISQKADAVDKADAEVDEERARAEADAIAGCVY